MPHRCKWGVVPFLALVLEGALAGVSHAQIFVPSLPAEEHPGTAAPRFTLGAYGAEWENPFRVTVSTVSRQMNFRVVSRTVRVVGDTPASPLLEGKYSLGRRWTLGFWYN